MYVKCLDYCCINNYDLTCYWKRDGVAGLVFPCKHMRGNYFLLVTVGLLSYYELTHFFPCCVQVHLVTETAYKSCTGHVRFITSTQFYISILVTIWWLLYDIYTRMDFFISICCTDYLCYFYELYDHDLTSVVLIVYISHIYYGISAL